MPLLSLHIEYKGRTKLTPEEFDVEVKALAMTMSARKLWKDGLHCAVLQKTIANADLECRAKESRQEKAMLLATLSQEPFASLASVEESGSMSAKRCSVFIQLARAYLD